MGTGAVFLLQLWAGVSQPSADVWKQISHNCTITQLRQDRPGVSNSKSQPSTPNPSPGPHCSPAAWDGEGQPHELVCPPTHPSIHRIYLLGAGEAVETFTGRLDSGTDSCLMAVMIRVRGGHLLGPGLLGGCLWVETRLEKEEAC